MKNSQFIWIPILKMSGIGDTAEHGCFLHPTKNTYNPTDES